MTYRESVLRNCPDFNSTTFRDKLLLGTLGVGGEAGEVVDLVKKVLFHNKELEYEKLIKEIGDVRWYLEYLCLTLNVTMAEVEEANMKKLMARYPDGFTYEAANASRKE